MAEPFGEVLDYFHLVVSVVHVRTNGNRAVVAQEHAVRLPDEPVDRLGELSGRGGAVLGERDTAERGADAGGGGSADGIGLQRADCQSATGISGIEPLAAGAWG